MPITKSLEQAIKEAKSDGSSLFSYEFDTAIGTIDCLAEVHLSGDSIDVRSFCIYPKSASPPIAKGTLVADTLRQFRHLLQGRRPGMWVILRSLSRGNASPRAVLQDSENRY